MGVEAGRATDHGFPGRSAATPPEVDGVVDACAGVLGEDHVGGGRGELRSGPAPPTPCATRTPRPARVGGVQSLRDARSVPPQGIVCLVEPREPPKVEVVASLSTITATPPGRGTRATSRRPGPQPGPKKYAHPACMMSIDPIGQWHCLRRPDEDGRRHSPQQPAAQRRAGQARMRLDADDRAPRRRTPEGGNPVPQPMSRGEPGIRVERADRLLDPVGAVEGRRFSRSVGLRVLPDVGARSDAAEFGGGATPPPAAVQLPAGVGLWRGRMHQQRQQRSRPRARSALTEREVGPAAGTTRHTPEDP